MMLIEIAVLLLFSYSTKAFNLEYRTNSIAFGETDSYYGYSIAVQPGANKRLFVGAPKAKSGRSTTRNVWQCKEAAERNLSCDPFKSVDGNNADNQWLGATISTSVNGFVVCDPKYSAEGDGRCYLYKNQEKKPNLLDGEGYSICGMSAAYSPDSEQLYVGGPGHNYNAGLVWKVTMSTLAKRLVQTRDRSYFGYSLASGSIAKGTLGFAASIPFHIPSNYKGKVGIHVSETGAEVESLLGTQPGEYFGASIAVTDVNGDQRDDIIIGAPQFTDYNDPQIKYDTGKVYVFYQSSTGMSEKFELQGSDVGGRFGSAVCAVGDVNSDRYNDIAVGAPYEDSGQGVVYLYHGFHSGIRSKPGQVIRAKEFTKSIRSFGYSLSGGVDFDGNGYPDLFVGAYQSDSVVYLPARSIIRLEYNTVFFEPNQLSLEEKNCNKQSEKVTCVFVKHCVKFRDRLVPKISVNASLSLDVKKQDPRLLFLDSGGSVKSQVMALDNGKDLCQSYQVYVKPNIRDKLNAMEVQIELKMAKDDIMSPVLDMYRDERISASLPIKKRCGQDDVCIPDLRMTAKTDSKTHIQGTKDRLTVHVEIFNAKEDAYESEFLFQIPSSLSYINVNQSSTDYLIHCSPPTEENKLLLRCDVGNPIQQNEVVKFAVFLQPTPDVFSSQQSVDFFMEVNSTNREAEETLLNNRQKLSLTFDAKTSLSVNGWFQPESIKLNLTALAEKEDQQNRQQFTQQVAQFYEISSGGPSDVIAADIEIVVPVKTIHGHDLFKFTSLPEIVEGPLDCVSDIKLEDPNNQEDGQGFKDPSVTTTTALPTTVENELNVSNTALVNRFSIIRCKLGRIGQSSRAILRLTGTFFISALTQFDDITLTISSWIEGNVTALPFGKDPSAIQTKKKIFSITVEKSVTVISLASAPIWLHITSAIVALVILGLLALLAKKMGFFKRNKPPTVKE